MNFPEQPSSLEGILRRELAVPRAVSERSIRVLLETSAKSERTAAAAEQLRRGEALAVFTGQQLGLFLGPAFTLYKIASAVALASKLREKLAAPVVPIFWLQSDDHDYDEVRH